MEREPFGPHENSLYGQATSEQKDQIRRARARMYEDQREMETWYRGGCTSGSRVSSIIPLFEEDS